MSLRKLASAKYNVGKNQHRGFSLIEVLVSVLIMAVGILGVAGLQVVSLSKTEARF